MKGSVDLDRIAPGRPGALRRAVRLDPGPGPRPIRRRRRDRRLPRRQRHSSTRRSPTSPRPTPTRPRRTTRRSPAPGGGGGGDDPQQLGVQGVDPVLALGLHQHAAQDPAVLDVGVDPVPAGGRARRRVDGVGGDEDRLAGGRAIPASSTRRRRRSTSDRRAAAREVGDDVQLGRLVQRAACRESLEQLRPAARPGDRAAAPAPRPVRGRRQQLERQPQRGGRRAGPRALQARSRPGAARRR